MTPDDVIPADWCALAQQLESLQEKLVLRRSMEDELRNLELKRGSRRWLPPAGES